MKLTDAQLSEAEYIRHQFDAVRAEDAYSIMGPLDEQGEHDASGILQEALASAQEQLSSLESAIADLEILIDDVHNEAEEPSEEIYDGR